MTETPQTPPGSKPPPRSVEGWGIGLALGIAIGVAIGLAFALAFGAAKKPPIEEQQSGAPTAEDPPPHA
ncbi:hypothetical protein BJY17_001861 [Agromyces hippuratus]|uniref:Uncharacterized protein n=1 Tax=Agromyces hippuratus TaxID=286438 RepID=A0A852X137_9MICO|nr:hypothetical protein [Agromyces hippuratus]NYG21114.1 hypothetical protein [Agromyces hippuratus]